MVSGLPVEACSASMVSGLPIEACSASMVSGLPFEACFCSLDREIPTEAILAGMRNPERPVSSLVGTPKSKIRQHEKKWLDLPWQNVRDSVQVKLFAQDGELYVLAKSEGRQQEDIAIRRKRLVRLLRKLRAMRRSLPLRDQLLMRIGRGQDRSGPGLRLCENCLDHASR